MSTHIGRSFTGHRLEDQCPCPQEKCGLVDSEKVHKDCDQHQMWAAKTIRQGHPDKPCQAMTETIKVESLGEDGGLWIVTGTTDAHSAEVAVRQHEFDLCGETLEAVTYGHFLGLGFEYRTDFAFSAPDDHTDGFLLCGSHSVGLEQFAGFRVTL